MNWTFVCLFVVVMFVCVFLWGFNYNYDDNNECLQFKFSSYSKQTIRTFTYENNAYVRSYLFALIFSSLLLSFILLEWV